MNTQESTKQCKACLEHKVAIYSHSDSTGHIIRKDEKGRQWKGHVCPTCESLRRTKQRAGKKNALDNLG